jgi:tetratricopeptide (TPR) repeat protein
MVLILSRQYEQALDYLTNELEIEPDSWLLRYRLGLAYEQSGDLPRAIDEFQKARRESDIPLVMAFLGHAYGLSGRRDEAQEMIVELAEMTKRYYVSPFYVALVYLGLGLKDLVFDWLNKSFEERAEAMASLMVNPRLDSLRLDPRFQDLLYRVGLTQ